jgi:hypothetical protein
MIFTSEDRENISLCISVCHSLLYNYHIFTETEGNSVFCGPETAVVAQGKAEGNNGGRGTTKHTAGPARENQHVRTGT